MCFMYKRKVEKILQMWLDNPSHKPLVVKGVRQCGKTSSVVDFAHKHFKNVVYLVQSRFLIGYSISHQSKSVPLSPHPLHRFIFSRLIYLYLLTIHKQPVAISLDT